MGALLADCGDACLLDASGVHGEGDAGGGCDLPHSYQLSASFCSESGKKITIKYYYNRTTLGIVLFLENVLRMIGLRDSWMREGACRKPSEMIKKKKSANHT